MLVRLHVMLLTLNIVFGVLLITVRWLGKLQSLPHNSGYDGAFHAIAALDLATFFVIFLAVIGSPSLRTRFRWQNLLALCLTMCASA